MLAALCYCQIGAGTGDENGGMRVGSREVEAGVMTFHRLEVGARKAPLLHALTY